MTIDDRLSLWRQYDWQIELDLRSIKITLQMDRLRCKTPELVRKEKLPRTRWTSSLISVRDRAAATIALRT